jgi:uncharacterized membrane protein (DUF485 family)
MQQHYGKTMAVLVALLSGGYYAVVAFAPHWLRPQLFGFPFSILLGLGIFAVGAAICLCYAFLPAASEQEPPTLPPGDL